MQAESLLDLLSDDEAPAPDSEVILKPSDPILVARDRIGDTLNYLEKFGRAPKRSQILNLLRELRDDLTKAAA